MIESIQNLDNSTLTKDKVKSISDLSSGDNHDSRSHEEIVSEAREMAIEIRGIITKNKSVCNSRVLNEQIKTDEVEKYLRDGCLYQYDYEKLPKRSRDLRKQINIALTEKYRLKILGYKIPLLKLSMVQKNETDFLDAVSYTHLTLPTIYSV